MQVQWNPESRISMCFIGDENRDKKNWIPFTFDDPGPRELSVQNLSEKERNQVLYNMRRGILLVDNKDELINAVKLEATTITWSPPVEPKQVVVDENKVRNILSGHHATVKRLVPEMSLQETRAALKLEQTGKGRKSVLQALEEHLAIQSKQVQSLFPGGDVPADSLVDSGPKISTRVGDVVEFEEEDEVVLIPLDQDL